MPDQRHAGAQVVRRDTDRFGTPIRFLNGQFHLKVSGIETDGALCIFDTVRTERGGPPLHVHHTQDEWFRVEEGLFDVRIGDTTQRLGPGDSILAPRGVPHCFANVTDTGRILVMFQPAGTMEAFFQSGSRLGPMSLGQFAALSAEHGMTVVGPPLPLD
jgi:mannose-6-phosphate isomerase-like protein (cupin superfamily)